mmetsp:Transcript_123872/g.276804  ORF Transcript_123872/g.276804 Transcript_123872/m.276804 type:complete len:208 (+) Transcript_123872:197-820(+)
MRRSVLSRLAMPTRCLVTRRRRPSTTDSAKRASKRAPKEAAEEVEVGREIRSTCSKCSLISLAAAAGDVEAVEASVLAAASQEAAVAAVAPVAEVARAGQICLEAMCRGCQSLRPRVGRPKWWMTRRAETSSSFSTSLGVRSVRVSRRASRSSARNLSSSWRQRPSIVESTKTFARRRVLVHCPRSFTMDRGTPSRRDILGLSRTRA